MNATVPVVTSSIAFDGSWARARSSDTTRLANPPARASASASAVEHLGVGVGSRGIRLKDVDGLAGPVGRGQVGAEQRGRLCIARAERSGPAAASRWPRADSPTRARGGRAAAARHACRDTAPRAPRARASASAGPAREGQPDDVLQHPSRRRLTVWDRPLRCTPAASCADSTRRSQARATAPSHPTSRRPAEPRYSRTNAGARVDRASS